MGRPWSLLIHPLFHYFDNQVKMQTEIEMDKKHETEHDDLERAPTGKGEMEEERIELSEEDVSLISGNTIKAALMI
jgi:hypothetical protein